MKIIYNYLLPLFLCFYGVTIFAQHSIVGGTEFCASDCETYSVNNGAGGPYYWLTTGSIQESNQGESVEICWTAIGENSVQLVDFSAPFTQQTVNLTTEVSSIPSPEVIFPLYPNCVVRDSLDGDPTGGNEIQPIECYIVCSGSIATYTSLYDNGNTITWEITGGTILSQNQDEITIEWQETGSGQISIASMSPLGCIESEDYCIEIAPPLDVDIVVFNGSLNNITVCLGQEVYLQAIASLDVTSFDWYFSNDEFATGSNTSISFDEPGTYEVMLTGHTDCGCYESSTYNIIVESNPGPEIMCIGSTCANEEKTYQAEPGCSNYSWSVSSNGSIIEGGGANDDYITINWNNGPVGDVGLSVSGCSEATCAIETVVQIPIIDNTATIDGPVTVCKDGYSRYSVQYYNGTDYQWNLSGNGQIIEGYGTNEIAVQWDNALFTNDQATLTVTYDNCYLNCGGQASLDINLRPDFQVNLNQEICTESNPYINVFTGFDAAIVDIEVIAPNGVSEVFPSVSVVSKDYTEIGKYQVIITDSQDDYCNNEIITSFEVVARPLAPTTISGPTTVCINEYYTYSVPLPGAGIEVFWRVKDGTNQTSQTGNEILVQWKTNGPYELRVSYRLEDLYCNSDTYTINISPAQNATITGSDIVCQDELATYTTGSSTSDNATWTISPADAGSLSINNDNTIDVTWHTAGNHQILSDFCGASITYDVEVKPLPNFTATFLEKVCPGEQSNVDIPITSGSSLEITDEDKILVSSLSVTNLDPGKYLATVTSAFGCEQIIPIVIDSFLGPQVRVSSPQENAYCLPHPGIEIVALATDDGYTYEWFFNNVTLGLTTPTITRTAYGDYHAIVTDQNGCTAKSNIHTLWEWCEGDPPPGTCTGGGGGSVSFDPLDISCNRLQFNITGGGLSSTTFNWNFDDPDSGPNNTAMGTNPIHDFTSAGYYYVAVVGNAPGEDNLEIIPVLAAPRFDYDEACANSAVQFNNHSTFIPGFVITNYHWDFGDPSSGADNTSSDKDPAHIFSTPGKYNVTLDIWGNTGCISAYQLEVDVLEGPQAEFVLPYSTCADKGLKFIGVETDEIISYAWDFGDPSSGDANTSNSATAVHTFTTGGIYNIELTTSDIDGCETVISKSIDINTTSISGDIISDKAVPVCYQEEVILTAPAGGTNYLWSNGGSGQSITVNEPGLYSVTIADPSGCFYEPEPFNMIVESKINSDIRGYTYDGEFDFNGEQYLQSLTICEGERISFRTQYSNNANFDWSIGDDGSYWNEGYEFRQLPPGDHYLTVKITDNNTSCEIESDPFLITINALPQRAELAQTGQSLCDGESHTLSISNPEAGVRYFWSNGSEGISTTVNSAGYYFPTAINSNGCSKIGEGINILQRPNANRINLGCVTACFPDTICTPYIPGASSYRWMKDGVEDASLQSNDIIIDEAGEYQLIVENYFGCADTSDILSIEAEPSDQSISGIVYIDDNGNGVWDAGEELLLGVPVSVYDGSTLVTTVTTDASGLYLFDPIITINPIIKIDTTGLGLEVTGGLFEMAVQFKTCIEDKLQDFPLIKNCSPNSEDLEYFVCKDGNVTINNIVLVAGDDWTFDDTNSSGCDSITNVIVYEHPEATVNLQPSNSCPNTNGGRLDIIIMSGTGLQFALDTPTTFTSDLYFDNLTPGEHMLWLFDGNGCSKSIAFTIEEEAAPQMSVATTNTCQGGNTGSAQITPIEVGDYSYSIDGINFNNQTNIDNLPAGNWTVYVQDNATTCIHQYTIEILANPIPAFNLATENSCNGGATGSVNITAQSSGNFEYSLDGINYYSDLDYSDISVGVHTLYILENGECPYTESFTIDENAAPEMELLPSNTCIGMESGSFTINPISSGNYQYSLDGINFIDDLYFSSLAEGNYTLYILEDGTCMTNMALAIEAEPDPIVTFTSEDACIGESNGQIIGSSNNQILQYSLDQLNFSTDSIITDLGEGVYTIFVLADNGCIHPFEVEIEEAEEMIVLFDDPVVDCTVRDVLLNPFVENAVGDVSYLWSDGSDNPMLNANQDGEYTVDVSDECSTSSYTYNVELEEIIKEQPVYFPNIFSPNNDGVNECFIPAINPEAQIISYKLLVFDRWGNKYFETTDIDECWDGRYNEKNVRAGVFVYYLELEYTFCVEVEKVEKYGDVTVVE